jgi:glycosyltransferase involved in cell wall biosynthesis
VETQPELSAWAYGIFPGGAEYMHLLESEGAGLKGMGGCRSDERSSRPTGPIRLLVLGQLPPPYGGMEVMTETLLNSLRRRQEFVIRNIDTQASRSLAEKGGKHQLRKSLRGAVQTAKVLHSVLSFRPQIVYLPLTSSPSFLGFLRDSLLITPGLVFRKTVVLHLHNGYYAYAHTTGLKRAFVAAVLRRVSLAIVLGDRLLSVFNDLIPPSRLACVPNGIDDVPFAAARARRANTGAQRAPITKRVLFVGLMHRPKGFRDVLSAIPAVPEAEFVFMGEWPSSTEEQEVRARVADQGIADRTSFAGVVTGNRKYDLFLSADVFVLPSYSEGLPVVVVEALAAGLPIVCTDTGALYLTVKDGWNGFFVPEGSPEAIAQRLNLLLADDVLRQLMGERSRRLFEEKFTAEQFIDNLARVMRECAAKNGR